MYFRTNIPQLRRTLNLTVLIKNVTTKSRRSTKRNNIDVKEKITAKYFYADSLNNTTKHPKNRVNQLNDHIILNKQEEGTLRVHFKLRLPYWLNTNILIIALFTLISLYCYRIIANDSFGKQYRF